jgi:hypothetical protein
VADVYRYALALCGTRSAAEDVTLSTFTEAPWAPEGVERRIPRKRLVDIAHEICRTRLEEGRAGTEDRRCSELDLAISRHLDGRQGHRARRALRAHLRACADCAAFLDEVTALRAALKELAQIPVPDSLTPLENPRARLPEGRHLNW